MQVVKLILRILTYTIKILIVIHYSRDVCQNGFSDDVIGKADAVFLDLPHPHLVIPFAIKALKPSGKVRINDLYLNCINLFKWFFNFVS